MKLQKSLIMELLTTEETQITKPLLENQVKTEAGKRENKEQNSLALQNKQEEQIEKNNEVSVKIASLTPFVENGDLIQLTPDVEKVCITYAASKLFPGYDTPAKVFVALQISHNSKLPLQSVLENMPIVNNRPSISARLAHILFLKAGGKILSKNTLFVKDANGKNVFFGLEYLGEYNGRKHKESFTLEDAHRAGLTSKDNWIKYPDKMCRARALSALIDELCPSCRLGFYTSEEVEDF